jgi:hypothetical protein
VLLFFAAPPAAAHTGPLDVWGGHYCREDAFKAGQCGPVNSYVCHRPELGCGLFRGPPPEFESAPPRVTTPAPVPAEPEPAALVTPAPVVGGATEGVVTASVETDALARTGPVEILLVVAFMLAVGGGLALVLCDVLIDRQAPQT